MLAGETGGDLDDVANVEIAVTTGLKMFDAFAGETDNGFRLGTGADSDFEIATKGRDDGFTTEDG